MEISGLPAGVSEGSLVRTDVTAAPAGDGLWLELLGTVTSLWAAGPWIQGWLWSLEA